jgi:protein TonB
MPDSVSNRSAPWQVWIAALLGAVALHFGCAALAIALATSDDVDEPPGALAIEVGLDVFAPRVLATELPPGLESEAAEASPEVVAQAAVVEQTDLPKATATETDDPDRVVSPIEPKEVKEEEKQVTALAAPSMLSIAAEATAPPSSEAMPEAPRSTAPVLGTGTSAQRVRTTWQKELLSHLDKHKRYPSDRSHQAAEIVVSFTLDRTGHILSATVVRGSGDASFDQAALAMLRRSDPVPRPPPLVADEGLDFTLPVIFRRTGRY